MNHGITVLERETSFKSSVMGDSAIPLIIGTAPINMVEDPTVNKPVLCVSYAEAVKSFGSLTDYTGYTILEAVEVLYSLYGINKAIFVNVLDPAKHKRRLGEETKTLTDDELLLEQVGIIPSSLTIKSTANETFNIDEDYTYSFEDNGYMKLVRVDTGDIDSNSNIKVSYDYIDPSMVKKADIIGGVDSATMENKGLECIHDVFPKYAVVPTMLLAPGYSHEETVASIMATKVKNISGVFNAIAIADIYHSSITNYSKVAEYKNNNSLIDPDLILCYPKVTNGDKEYWMSTHIAGVMAVTDSSHGGFPHISPSNQGVKATGLINNGKEVLLNNAQANILNENGVVTLLNFIGGFKVWGNHSSCYPSNSDVKDKFITSRRVFKQIANTIVTTYWQNIDMPILKRTIEDMVSNIQFWLDSLASQGFIVPGAKVTFPDDLNNTDNLTNGKVFFHIKLAAAVPAQDMNFILEYDVNLLKF